MGLFDKISKAFEKKSCDICGGEIGLLGNRKLDDGNLCKDCAAKLSPWFNERRHSTVAQIKEQLDYREANREEVKKFHTTRTLGTDKKILIDEDARKFVITSARDLVAANPDVIDFSQVTGCVFDIDEEYVKTPLPVFLRIDIFQAVIVFLRVEESHHSNRAVCSRTSSF